jgi:hypothetical protein
MEGAHADLDTHRATHAKSSTWLVLRAVMGDDLPLSSTAVSYVLVSSTRAAINRWLRYAAVMGIPRRCSRWNLWPMATEEYCSNGTAVTTKSTRST